jgi:hypothetical protein
MPLRFLRNILSPTHKRPIAPLSKTLGSKTFALKKSKGGHVLPNHRPHCCLLASLGLALAGAAGAAFFFNGLSQSCGNPKVIEPTKNFPKIQNLWELFPLTCGSQNLKQTLNSETPH